LVEKAYFTSLSSTYSYTCTITTDTKTTRMTMNRPSEILIILSIDKTLLLRRYQRELTCFPRVLFCIYLLAE
jgi:hypothetical protein